jgi:hypothetical protein
VVGQHYRNTNPGIQSGWSALWEHKPRNTEWLVSIMGTQTQGYRVVGQHYKNTNPGIQSGWPALWEHKPRDTEWLASIMGTQTQGYRVVISVGLISYLPGSQAGGGRLFPPHVHGSPLGSRGRGEPTRPAGVHTGSSPYCLGWG